MRATGFICVIVDGQPYLEVRSNVYTRSDRELNDEQINASESGIVRPRPVYFDETPMNDELLSRSIIAMDHKESVYTINEYTAENEVRYELYNGTPVVRYSDWVFHIEEGGIDLRAVYRH